MARCVKPVDDHEDYHHHYYGDYYVFVSVDPFEYGHSSLLFLEVLWFWNSLASKITAVGGALPCDKLGHCNFQIRTGASELGQYHCLILAVLSRPGLWQFLGRRAALLRTSLHVRAGLWAGTIATTPCGAFMRSRT